MKAATTMQRSVRTQRTVTLPTPVQLKCACGASAERSADECEECARGRKLQAKLRVNAPGDALEHEADRIADRVLAMPEPSHSSHQAPVSTAAATGTTEAPAIVGETLNEGGTALDADTRAWFEPRFGYDFSRVRIHTGALAARSADAVGARAYAVGNDLVFAPGEYAPRSSAGRKLLAHELAHVMQQQGTASLSRMPVLQREPKKSKMGRILSLEEVRKDRVRKAKQELNGQTVARVYKDTSGRIDGDNAPATLKTGDQVWIIKTLPGELWMQIEAGGIKPFGPAQVAYVLAAFVHEVPAAVVGDPKPVPATEQKKEPAKVAEPAKETTEAEQIRSLIESRPKEYVFEGDDLNPKTNLLMNGLLLSKYLWFHAPKHKQRAIDYIERVYKDYHRNKLDIWEYEKKFGGLHSLENRQMTPFFLAARDALKHFHDYTLKSRAGWDEERNWDTDIEALKKALEPISVLLDGRKPADMAQFEKGRSMLRLEAPKAFVDGVLEGAKAELTDADYKLLAEKLAATSFLSIPLMPVAAAGTAVGVAKDIYDTLKGFYEMVTAPVEMAKQMIELIMTLMLDKEGARQIGVAIGQQEGKEISKIAKEDLVTFTYKLYEKVGPLVVSAALSFVTGGQAGAARMGAAFQKMLARSQKARVIVNKVKALLPEKRKKVHVPDVPDATDLPDIKPKKPALPEVPTHTPGAPAADVAKAARKWAKETLDFTEETLADLNPAAIKKLQDLPKEDLSRIRKLSDKARRYLLDCHSPCDVDGPDIHKKLKTRTNPELELDAKAAEKALAELEKLDLKALRQRARTDKMAADMLQDRYAAMSDAQLRKLAKQGHAGAQTALDANSPENTALKKIAKGHGTFTQKEVLGLLEKDLKKARKDSGIRRTGGTAVTPDDPVKGGTMATARTNVPGLENDLTVGKSPGAGGKVNPDSEFAPDTDLKTLPQTHGHAEQNLADQIAKKLASVDPKDLNEKRVWMLVEQEPCSTCAQGIGSLHNPGVLMKLSKKFPDVIFEIKNNRTSGLIRIRNGIPLE